jgi:hypothetical protein
LISFCSGPFALWGGYRQAGYKRAKVKRLIFLGLDGLDPGLAERYTGRQPPTSALASRGFIALATFPGFSPVAWSTFATGVTRPPRDVRLNAA